MDMDPGIKAELTSVKQKPDLAGYNVVTMVDVLHHVPRASQAAFLADVASRMDAGAKLILMDIDAGRPLRAMANQLHDLLLSREWVQPVSAKKAFDLLGQATLTPAHPRLFSTLWYGHYLITAVKQG